MRRFRKIHRLATPVVCLSLLACSVRANADRFSTIGDEIVIGIVATSVAIGVAIGFSIHAVRNHSLEGCIVAGPGALELRQSGNPQLWALSGDIASLQPGRHVSVAGKRQKKTAAATRDFLVEKVKKNYGPCS